MRRRIQSFLEGLNLSRRFMLASLVVLTGGLVGIGMWVNQKIEAGVVDRSGATAALYVDSAVSPYLQELADTNALPPDDVAGINTLLRDTPLGEQMVIFKVWNTEGKVVYSTDTQEVGQTYPIEEGLAESLRGNVTSEITDLSVKAENAPERQPGLQLLEIYSPVRQRGTNRIIGVMEFYQSVADLKEALAAAQRETWLVVGPAGLAMYIILALFVRRASNTIDRQRDELSAQVLELRELHERVRRAAARTTAVNERFLRRISAELHDGPAQELALALFQLDDQIAELQPREPAVCEHERALPTIANSVRHALEEVRAISTGLGVPELRKVGLLETLNRAVRAHERRTKTQVAVDVGPIPKDVPLSVKIAVYRVVQEALNNASHHAGGAGQRVRLEQDKDQLVLEVSDQGPGFDGVVNDAEESHLGLVGMRERVESLGGWYQVESHPGRGTTIHARLPIHAPEVTI